MKTRSVIYLLIYAVMIALGHILQKMVLNYGVNRFIFAFLRITTGFFIITLLLIAKKFRPVPVIKKISAILSCWASVSQAWAFS